MEKIARINTDEIIDRRFMCGISGCYKKVTRCTSIMTESGHMLYWFSCSEKHAKQLKQLFEFIEHPIID